MKLQQLRYICEIERNGCNISAASDKLFTSQPGVSKQVAVLESELGVKIFERKGKHLFGPTQMGSNIIQEARKMLDIESRIKSMCASVTAPDTGMINIHTTNSIIKFLLPDTIQYLMKNYPKVSLQVGEIEPNTPDRLLPSGSNDFSIVAQNIEEQANLIILPAYKWSLSLIIPSDHPLATDKNITLDKLANEKLISYELGSTGRTAVDDAFSLQGLSADYIITSMDAEIIKEYVSRGVGIGIVASVSTDTMKGSITARSLEGLIPDCYAWLCYSKDIYLQQYMYDFIEKFAPHLSRTVIENIANVSKPDLIKWFDDVQLSTYR